MKYYRPKKELTGKQLSAFTLASFMAAQSVGEPDKIRADLEMSADLLRFLIRNRAISYWSSQENGWLKTGSTKQQLALTGKGIRKVHDRLTGQAGAQSVTRSAVLEALQVIRGFVKLEPLDELEIPDQDDQASTSTSTSIANNIPLEIDEKILAAIWTRRGQPEFRSRLLEAYDSRCAITQCEVVDALEAAHITPFAEEKGYDVSNGLLLRSDIHTLFDLFLLSINPISWKVHIAPQLSKNYGVISGVQISLPTETSSHPDRERLLRHYNEWQRRWHDVRIDG